MLSVRPYKRTGECTRASAALTLKTGKRVFAVLGDSCCLLIIVAFSGWVTARLPRQGAEPLALGHADIKTGSRAASALDDYFARQAAPNDVAGRGRAHVLRRVPDDDGALSTVLGFYTVSMASAESAQVAKVVEKKLPKYPMPVALIGRLAIDQRAQGRRLGEKLLMDALRRVVHAASIVGCTGEAPRGYAEPAEDPVIEHDQDVLAALDQEDDFA